MRLQAGALLLAAVFTTPELRYFAYDRPVVVTPATSSQTCLVLDADIFNRSAKHLADLRLYRDTIETPYAIHVAAPVGAGTTALHLLNLGVHGKQTTFDAAMPAGSYTDLELGIVGQDFIATVTVFGSHTQAGGTETKLGSYTIFDLTRQKLGRSTVLHLPESDFHYLHFQIDGSITPGDVTSLAVDRLLSSLPRYQPITQSSKVTMKDRESIFVVTVPAHVPVDRITFHPASAPIMFSRDVRVDVEAMVARPTNDGVEDPPAPVTFNGNLLRLHKIEDGHRIDEEHLTLDTPLVEFEVPSRWTVSIQNGDDVPLNVDSVRFEMLERELCFEAEGSAHYALYYGDPALSAPMYDYAGIFTLHDDAAKASIGPEQRNPDYRARPDLRPYTEKHPGLLWAALLGVVALLGGVALRSFSRTTGDRRPADRGD